MRHRPDVDVEYAGEALCAIIGMSMRYLNEPATLHCNIQLYGGKA